MIVPRKYMHIISVVGLFCCDKFEETPNEKVVNMSKLTKSYFNVSYWVGHPSPAPPLSANMPVTKVSVI